MLPAFVLCATFLAQFTQSEAKGTLVLSRCYSASYFTQRTQRNEERRVLFSLRTRREIVE
jgi:hypothetical protein